MVKIEGLYFCPVCKRGTYHGIINETRAQLLGELSLELDIEPSKFSAVGILTCTECMTPNYSINKD